MGREVSEVFDVDKKFGNQKRTWSEVHAKAEKTVLLAVRNHVSGRWSADTDHDAAACVPISATHDDRGIDSRTVTGFPSWSVILTSIITGCSSHCHEIATPRADSGREVPSEALVQDEGNKRERWEEREERDGTR